MKWVKTIWTYSTTNSNQSNPRLGLNWTPHYVLAHISLQSLFTNPALDVEYLSWVRLRHVLEYPVSWPAMVRVVHYLKSVLFIMWLGQTEPNLCQVVEHFYLSHSAVVWIRIRIQRYKMTGKAELTTFFFAENNIFWLLEMFEINLDPHHWPKKYLIYTAKSYTYLSAFLPAKLDLHQFLTCLDRLFSPEGSW